MKRYRKKPFTDECKMPFGKYGGNKLGSIKDKSYMTWFIHTMKGKGNIRTLLCDYFKKRLHDIEPS